MTVDFNHSDLYPLENVGYFLSDGNTITLTFKAEVTRKEALSMLEGLGVTENCAHPNYTFPFSRFTIYEPTKETI